uniref:Homeobox domain-containing protein n=1 Tax=Peronospora matthiolae TaxID=2874970 RepID=A0AAV1TKS1_9STRA
MAGKDAMEARDGADIAMHPQFQVNSMASTSSTRSGGATSCSTTSSTVPKASPDRRRLKRPHVRSLSIANDSVALPHQKTKKRLRWSTITVHEFGVGLGGSSVPGKGGPSIGLSDKPEFTWTTEVGQMAERVEGVHRFTPTERVQLLQSAGVSEGMILRFSREANIINCSRRRTLVEDIAERKEAKRQQRRQAPPSSRPCVSPFVHRPHMIPVDYV